MERDLEGYSRGVKNIIKSYQQKKLSGITIHGPLSQLIKVDKKYITAVETALGNTAQNIVTDTPEDAKTAIKYLKQNNLGRATFLPISTIKAKNINNSSPKVMMDTLVLLTLFAAAPIYISHNKQRTFFHSCS